MAGRLRGVVWGMAAGICLTLTAAGGVLGQTSTNTGEGSDGSAPPKQALAVGIDTDLITVDGRLDDDAWREAHFFADFLQKEPEQGAPPTERTEIAFVYDGGGHILGPSLFMHVVGATDEPTSATFALPQGWRLRRCGLPRG